MKNGNKLNWGKYRDLRGYVNYIYIYIYIIIRLNNDLQLITKADTTRELARLQRLHLHVINMENTF